MEKDQLLLILLTETRRTQYITRLQSTNQILDGYTVASHAQQCAIIYTMLCRVYTIPLNADLLTALLCHDNMEVFTGDLLAPTKNANDELWEELERRIQYDYIEYVNADPQFSAEGIALFFPIEDDLRHLPEDEYWLLKMIDCFELFLRCMEEYTSGNHSTRMTEVISNVSHYITSIFTIEEAWQDESPLKPCFNFIYKTTRIMLEDNKLSLAVNMR